MPAGLRTTNTLPGWPTAARKNRLQNYGALPIVSVQLTVSHYMTHDSDNLMFSPARDLRGLLLSARLLLPLRG